MALHMPRIATMAVLLGALLFLLTAGTAAAQDQEDCHLSGHILDKKDRTAVGGAIISMGSKMSVSFDDGYYNMTLPPGLYGVNITSPRYNTYSGVVNLTGNMTLDFELAKRPTASTCSTTGIVMVAPLAAMVLAVSAGRKPLKKRPGGPQY
jgi:hypothetical protein